MPRIPGPARAAFAVGLAWLLLATLPPAALAQGRQRIEDELRRTDEILDRAAEIVRDSDSARAHDLLDQARRIQGDARGQFAGGRFVQAGRLTLEARTIGARAATLARDDSSLGQRAERELERAARELDRVRDGLGDSRPAGALNLLDEATSLLERARGAFAEQQFQAAIRLAIASQRLAAHALVLGGGDGSRRLDRELERTDHLLDRLGPIVAAADDVAATRSLEEARALQARAREAERGGHPQAAMALTREARTLGNDVRARLGAVDDPAAVERALGETDRALERAANIVFPSGVTTARALLERARDHQSRGHAAFDAHDFRRALAQTRVARNLAARALQLVDAGGE